MRRCHVESENLTIALNKSTKTLTKIIARRLLVVSKSVHAYPIGCVIPHSHTFIDWHFQMIKSFSCLLIQDTTN